MNRYVSFTSMKEGTREDYEIIAENDRITASELPGRIMNHLEEMAEDDGAYQIDRLQHVLQCATRAYRDEANSEWIVACLVHDLGDLLAPYTHGQMAAEIIRPFVSEEVTWVVQHHPVFQKFYNKSLPETERMARDKYKDHPFYESTLRFCEEWDQCSFDPEYDTLQLEFFRKYVEEIFLREPFSS